MAQGENYIPWYHLNSRKRALKSCNGQTRDFLLKFKNPAPGRQSNEIIYAYTNRVLSTMILRQKLPICAFIYVKISQERKKVNKKQTQYFHYLKFVILCCIYKGKSVITFEM